MTDTIEKIIGMLGDHDPETRCAAAMVLARLRPLDDRAVEALRRGMKKAPLHARSYFLDALAATRDPRVIPDVIDMLESKGSVTDMAIGVSRTFGTKALDEIERRHEGVAGWINGAYIKAVAGIHCAKAARMLIDRLPAADWEQARATSMFFNEHFHRYPETGKAYVRKKLHRYLEKDAATLEFQVVITCLNLTRQFREPIDRDVLLRLAEEADTPSLRRHALGALEVLTPDLDRLDEHRRRLHELLDRAEGDEFGRPVVDVLAAWDEPQPALEELLELASRPGRVATDYAFQELARLYGDEAAPVLERELATGDRYRREAALAALCGIKDGLGRILRVFGSVADRELRRNLSEALIAGQIDIDAEAAAGLRTAYSDSATGEHDYDAALLHLLGARDREGLNDHLLAQARTAIASGEPERAIVLLQPLVRHRHAGAEARFVLALANLKASRDLRRLDEPRTKRTIDILAPLARTPGFDLAGRLKEAVELLPAELLTILSGLAEKGRMERAAGRELIGAFVEEGLEARDLRTLEHLRSDLGAGK